MTGLREIIGAFIDGLHGKALRNHKWACHPCSLSEKQLDNTIKASFPASDPPGTY